MRTKSIIAALAFGLLSSVTFAQAQSQSSACCKEKTTCCKSKEADKSASCKKTGEGAKKAETGKKATKSK